MVEYPQDENFADLEKDFGNAVKKEVGNLSLMPQSLEHVIKDSNCYVTNNNNELSTRLFNDITAPLIPKNIESIPYPVELLPEIVKNAVTEYQCYGQQPLAIIACSALANMSLACQGLADISRDEQLISPISLYFITIAESGERKTAADNHSSRGAKYWERQAIESLLNEIKKNKVVYDAWQARRKGLLNKIEKATEDTVEDLKQSLIKLEEQEPPKIITPNLYHEESTTEALAHSLATGWQSTSLQSDESGIIVGGYGMNQENITKFTALLNRLWDCNVHRVNRKTSESFRIEGRRFTCSLMMQSNIFEQLINRCSNVTRGNGFLARCLIINPASTMGGRFYKEPLNNMPYGTVFDERIIRLLSKPLPLDDKQRLCPEVLHLSHEAKALWIDFHNEIETELRVDGDFSSIKDFAAKAAENAVRLAGIFHVFCEENSNLVSLEIMQRAVGIVAWHLQEIKSSMGIYEIPQSYQDAQLLADWLTDKGYSEIKLADILQYAPSILRDKKRRDAAIDVLIEHNYLLIEERAEVKFAVLNPKIGRNKNV